MMTPDSRTLYSAYYSGFAAVVIVVCLYLSLAVSVLAHPLDDLTIRRINQYFIVDTRGEQPIIFYLLKMAEIPSFEEMNRIDPDYSRDVTDEEVCAYLDQRIPELLENLYVAVGNASVPLSVEKRRLKLEKGKGGLTVINVHLELRPEPTAWPDADQGLELVIGSDNFQGELGERECKLLHDGSFEDITTALDTNTQGMQTVIYRDDRGNAIYQDTNMQFHFRLVPVETKEASVYSEPTFDWVANPALTAANQETTVPGPDSPGVQNRPQTAIAGLSINESGSGILGRMFDQVSGRIRAKKLSAAMCVSGLLIALILGMVHALSPGHGKTVMAAYLIGERGTVWNAIALGIVMTITHTWSVLALGVVTLYAQERMPGDQLNFWLSITSGGIILAIGVTLLIRRYTAFVLSRHGISPGHSHHSNNHHHHHRHGDHAHSHVVKTDDGNPPGIWGILGMGISGGIVPCPSALIVLLLAVQSKRLAYGLCLILSFSLGLAVVLVVIGIMVVRAAGMVRQSSGGQAAIALLPVVSSAVITLLGLVLLAGTLVQYGVLVILP